MNKFISLRNFILGLGILLMCHQISLAQYERRNIGPPNHSTRTDGSPKISPDGRAIYYSRDKDGGATNYRPMVSYRNPDKTWAEGVEIEQWIKFDIERLTYIYPDNNTFIVNIPGSGANSGFAKIKRIASGWSVPKKLQFASLPWTNWSSHACTLTPDGKVMILGNEQNLFVSFLEPDSSWTRPQPLKDLNTSGAEFTPIFAPDYKTLYFSSDGHLPTLGNNDVYKTYPLDDTYLSWAKPENMGSPINTTDFDNHFSVPAQGDFAITYSKSEGSGDIFILNLPPDKRPEPVVLMNGITLDSKTNIPMQAQVYYENLTDNKAIGEALSAPVDGKFNVILAYGKKYGIRAEAKGYYPISENVDLTGTKGEYQEMNRNLKLTPIIKGENILLNNLFFNTGKFDLDPGSFPELDRLVNLMKTNPEIKIMIAGHTDNVGKATDNLSLSKSRAESVGSYLTNQGIEPSRLILNGFGMSVPLNPNTSEENKQRNRRVEFKIL